MSGVNVFLELLKMKSLEENTFKQRPSEQTQEHRNKELPKLALGQLQKNVQKVQEIWCVTFTSPPLVRTTVG